MPYRTSMWSLLALRKDSPSPLRFPFLPSLPGFRFGFSSPSPSFLRADIADVLGFVEIGLLDIAGHTSGDAPMLDVYT